MLACLGLWVSFVILVEFFGALFLVAGFATRLSAFAVIATFIGVVIKSHLNSGFFMNWSGQANQKERLEYFILLFGLALFSLIAGGGKAWMLLSQNRKPLNTNNTFIASSGQTSNYLKPILMKTNIKSFVVISLAIISLVILQGCKQNDPTGYTKPQIDSLKNIALQLVAANDSISEHLKTFDELDFDVFSNQKWERLKESHAKDIKVYWPDGHVAEGIDVHIEDLKKLFVHAPDTRIKMHPIKFGSGNYTLVTGVFEGTFTKPMPIGNGKFIQPTGKAFKMPMATVGIWENGVMKEEHLFWDNQTYATQIGLK